MWNPSYKKILVYSYPDPFWRTEQDDSNITRRFECSVKAICRAPPDICLLSGPGSICSTTTRPLNISFKCWRKESFLRPIFNLCLKILSPKDGKHTFSFCFELVQYTAGSPHCGGSPGTTWELCSWYFISPLFTWQSLTRSLRHTMYLH